MTDDLERLEYTSDKEAAAWTAGYAFGRAEALEEAAKVADYHTSVDSASISQAIRALKEKAPERIAIERAGGI